MARREYEETQKTNPHTLPVKQHVFPRASIHRFTDNNGLVSLRHISINRIRKAKPSDGIFCAMRAWDARAEFGYMKKIEDEFQELVSRIIRQTDTEIEAIDKHKIDQFFALWKMRAIYRAKEMADVSINGVTGEDLTKDQEEILEKKGILFVRKGGLIQAHRMHGLQIQTGIVHELSRLSSIKWVPLYAHNQEFIVPDFPVATFIPLNPTLSLCGTSTEIVGHGKMFNVININRFLKANSKEYYFANDLRKCFYPFTTNSSFMHLW